MRHTTTTLDPVGMADSETNWDMLALRALDRIRRNRKRTAAGSYVLGAPDGRVFVLAEGGGTTECMLRTHISWLIGTYASGKRAEYPKASQVVEDLMEHYS